MAILQELYRLEGIFTAWCNGTQPVTVEGWQQFQRDLRRCVHEAALEEIGLTRQARDAAAEAARPGSNVVMLPTTTERMLRQIERLCR